MSPTPLTTIIWVTFIMRPRNTMEVKPRRLTPKGGRISRIK